MSVTYIKSKNIYEEEGLNQSQKSHIISL